MSAILKRRSMPLILPLALAAVVVACGEPESQSAEQPTVPVAPTQQLTPAPRTMARSTPAPSRSPTAVQKSESVQVQGETPGSTTRDWKVTVHGSHEEPSRSGWKNVDFDIVVENTKDELVQLVQLPVGSFSFRAEWRDTAYNGSVSLPTGWLPRGYRANGKVRVEVPAAATDLTYKLSWGTSKNATQEIAVAGSYPPLPPMPTSREDQPSEIKSVEKRESFTLTFGEIEYELINEDIFGSPLYNVNLVIQLRNEGTQDLSIKDIDLIFQAWEPQGQVHFTGMANYRGQDANGKEIDVAATLPPLAEDRGVVTLLSGAANELKGDLRLLVMEGFGSPDPGFLQRLTAWGVSEARLPSSYEAYGTTLTFPPPRLQTNWFREVEGFNFPNIALDPSGNIYVAGTTVGSGETIGVIRKFSVSGVEQWAQEFNLFSRTDSVTGLAVTESGDLYVGGGSSAGVFVRKYGSSGAEQWSLNPGFAHGSTITSLAAYGKEVYVSGSGALGKLDPSNGASVWRNNVWPSHSRNSKSGSIAVHKDGNVYIVGDGVPPKSPRLSRESPIIRVFDSSGEELWTRVFEHPFGGPYSRRDLGEAQALAVAVDESGHVYMAGRVLKGVLSSEPTGEGALFLRKYAAGGKEEWIRQFGGVGANHMSVVVGPSGDVYVAGGGFLYKFDPSGDELWAAKGVQGQAGITTVVVDSRGDIYVAGQSLVAQVVERD